MKIQVPFGEVRVGDYFWRLLSDVIPWRRVEEYDLGGMFQNAERRGVVDYTRESFYFSSRSLVWMADEGIVP